VALTTDQLKKYWDTANVLRKNLDAAEYKHIVLGLVFLKYVSDSFSERREELTASFADPKSDRYKPDAKRLQAALDDRNYYKEVNVFWVPESSRWEVIQEHAKQADIASMVDNALYEIEKENPKLEGIVERRYADAKLPAADLGAVIDLIGSISFGNGRHEASDVLGQVYEYFLGMFASAEGKLGGQFYTTPSIVKTLVEVLQPTSGRVYDPCCGSGGMFVQSERFLEAHGGKLGDIAIYGQESNPTTRRLCAMNLAIRGIDFDLGKSHGDTFLENQHPDKRFDFILMNPPFGVAASYPRELLLNDVRWKKYGIPREKPANYAWLSHAVHHLAPKGKAGVVMPHSSLTSSQGDDDMIRRAFIEDGIVDCIIDLPGQLFFNTPIPSCLWFFSKGEKRRAVGRENEILFIDARSLGSKVSKTQIEFSDEEIQDLAEIYNNWSTGDYSDIPGLCKSVPISEIDANNHSLSPARYISSDESKQESFQDFATGINRLKAELASQFKILHSVEEKAFSQLSALGLTNSDDSELEPTRSLSDTAQETLSTIFRSWFVDFDPVIGKIEGVDSTGLSSEILDLFPGAMKESSIGLIPENWNVKSADEIFNVTIGRTPPRKEEEWFTTGADGVPWVSIRDMGRFAIYSGSTSEGLTQAAIEKFNVPVVPAGVVLMSFKLTVGKLCITNEPVATNEAIAHFTNRSNSKLSPFFTYLWLQNFDISSLDSTSSIGTATNSKLLKQIPFLVPDEKVMQAFDSLVAPLFELAKVLNLAGNGVQGDAKEVIG
jgi:type I restriction enzyme M protein